MALHLFWSGAFHAAAQEELQAEAVLEEAREMATAHGVTSVESCAATTRAWLSLFVGRPQEAVERAEACADLVVRSQDDWAISFLAFVHGLALLAMGDNAGARDRHADGLRHGTAIGHMSGATELLGTIALAAAHRGQISAASRLLGTIDALFDATGMARGMAAAVPALEAALSGIRDDEAYAEGHRTPFEDAAAFALEL